MPKDAKEIFGRHAAFYTTSESHRDKAILGRLVELACVRPNMCVLDVATGTGHTAFAFAPYVKNIIAIDITPEMLTEATKMSCELQVDNVLFVKADAQELPFGDEMFDIVTCRRATHHFRDISCALQEMSRVLKIGGRLIIDDRSVPEDDFIDSLMNNLDVLHDRSHVREYRPNEWDNMLTGATLRVELLEQYTKHRPLSSLTNRAEPEDAEKIRNIISNLTESQRAAMNIIKKNDGIYSNHWFIMLVGIKD